VKEERRSSRTGGIEEIFLAGKEDIKDIVLSEIDIPRFLDG